MIVPASTFGNTGAIAATQTNGDWVMPNGHLNITVEDLKFMLDQIKIGEAVAARTGTTGTALAVTPQPKIVYPFDLTSSSRCLLARDVISAGTNTFGATGLSNVYPYSNLESYGTRNVDGSCNNITNVGTATAAPTGTYKPVVAATDTAGWGAADELFIRTAKRAIAANYTLSPIQTTYSDPSRYVVDPTPRRISNLISDQSTNNPAAVEAATQAQIILYGKSTPVSENTVNATTGAVNQVLQIPNITPDYNVSAGYNSWFTLFGQFFDHGLDLIPKAGTSVYIPLDQSDPVYTPGAPNFMVLTRGANATTGESINTTTPYVDQSQTYGSHASQNFFLREYSFPTTGPVATGRLIEGSDGPHTALADGTLMPSTWLTGGLVDTTLQGTITNPSGAADLSNSGLAQWRDIKAQSRLLGIRLTDFDANSIPIIATDQYGNFVPNPATGYPLMLMTDGTNYQWQSGLPNAPLSTSYTDINSVAWTAVSSGHAFINDTMQNAVPFSGITKLTPDADSVMNSPTAPMVTGTYDNESLDAHYVAGDGRVNENIGLSSIHAVFHSEHNTVASDIENMLNAGVAAGLDPAFVAEWKTGSSFNGNRIYQAARIVTENEYQHMVYDEFIRRIVPSLPTFAAYDPNANASISAEFASAVYRVGHSMLNETIARSNPGTFYDPSNNQDVSLISGFTNPPQARLQRPMTVASASSNGTTVTYTLAANETAPNVGSIVAIQGMNVTAFNLTNAVVATRSTSTFTVSQQYAANSAGPVAISVTSGTSNSKPVSNTDATPIATVSVSDPGVGNSFNYTPMQSAASIAQGMSSQRGNEIDEFTTDGVRNNLLGLPLDLASLNMTRGRDTQLPTLNQFRAQNAKALPPYVSWVDYIAHLRYPESAVNFIAAYGTHPSLKSITIGGTVTSASSLTAGAVTYTATDTTGIHVGDTVTVTGLSSGNIINGVVASVPNSTSFTISQKKTHGPLDPQSFATGGEAYTYLTNASVPIVAGDLTTGTPTTGSVTRVPTVTEVRELARDLVAKGMDTNITGAVANAGSITYTSANNYSVGQFVTVSNVLATGTNCFDTDTLGAPIVGALVTAASASSFTITAPTAGCGTYNALGASSYVSGGTGLMTKTEATDFMNSTNAWSTQETGLNYVDLWTGGLAENPAKQPITPPMFGPVFQLVFADQALRLQNGDRFYYLGRLAGTNLGEEIPAQKFTDIIRRNTPSASDTLAVSSASGVLGMNSPGFSVSDCAFTGNTAATPSVPGTGRMLIPSASACGTGTMAMINKLWTHVGLDNVTGFGDPNSTSGTAIAGGAGDDSIFGTAGNDVLSGGISGGDLIDGYAGDDILIGGPGEDLLKGGAGNDTINAGDSALGDTVDGGSGNDFMHTGQSIYATASMIGESGDDFIQGSNGSDIALFGSEGSDWLEGLADIDTMFGDSGLAGALPIIKG
ncbi:MAG: peroxidase family protein, partial [Actinomycetes bacterium]